MHIDTSVMIIQIFNFFSLSLQGGSHDTSSLSIPGRAFYIQSRKMNEVGIFVLYRNHIEFVSLVLTR